MLSWSNLNPTCLNVWVPLRTHVQKGKPTARMSGERRPSPGEEGPASWACLPCHRESQGGLGVPGPEALLVPGGTLGHLRWGAECVIMSLLKDWFESKCSICTIADVKGHPTTNNQPFQLSVFPNSFIEILTPSTSGGVLIQK